MTSQADPVLGQHLRLWASVDINTSGSDPEPFNPNRIKVEVSSDGGNNFSPMTIAGSRQFDDGNGRRPSKTPRRRSRSARAGCRGERRIRRYGDPRRPGRGHL